MVPRRLFADGAFKTERYSKREALLDLIQMASIETKTVFVNGANVQIERGQVFASIRFLAKRWGWSNDCTIRTLTAFESEHFIERHPNAVMSTISICNFDLYSGVPNTTANATANTPDVESRTNNNNKEKEIKETDTKVSAKKSNRFVPPSVEDVKSYADSIGFNLDAEHFVNYYSARGWELNGGRKVKDWKACVRTWRGNQKKREGSTNSGDPKTTGDDKQNTKQTFKFVGVQRG